MAPKEIDRTFSEILSNLDNWKFTKITEALIKLIGGDSEEDLLDLEESLVEVLGRDLDANEIFLLRPIITEIESNYYEEE